jgi:general secretion pathway protein K
VLWVLLLLSGLAATAMYVARVNAILTHRALEIAQAEAAADAAIVHTISQLSDERVTRHPPINGTPLNWEFQGYPVAITITNEAGRIDVNSADDILILAFLYSQGVDQNDAQTLLEDLRRWQKSSLAPFVNDRASTAQAVESTQNGLRGRPLETINELRRIPSWTAQNLDCWTSSLTVNTGLRGISVGDATPRVLQALRWAQEHHLADRDWMPLNTPAGTTPDQRSVLGEVLRITASAAVSSNVQATTQWVGRLTGDRKKPMLTMRWDHKPQGESELCIQKTPQFNSRR